MINFLPISILAYALNGGSTVIDKILLRSTLPNPIVYAFYINILGLLAVLFFPFGLKFELTSFSFSFLSGIFFVFAVLTFFEALKRGEASIVAPIVGSLNPLLTALISALFLSRFLNQNQYLGMFVLLFGSSILTYNLWIKNLKPNKQLLLMILSAFFFALAYILLKEAFSAGNFITGLIISRIGAGVLVLSFLIFPSLRNQIFASKVKSHNFINKTVLLLAMGQTMGAASGLLITIGVYFANPALVNSLFGVQYLIILAAAFILSKHHPQLLDETLTLFVVLQKISGVVFLSIGVYLLSI